MFENLDNLLEQVTKPVSSGSKWKAKKVSNNFLFESAMLYSSVLAGDIQHETQMSKLDRGFKSLLESTGFTPEQKMERAGLLVEASVKDFKKSVAEKVKEMIKWIKGIIEKVVAYIKQKTDRLGNFISKQSDNINSLKADEYKGVTYKGFKYANNAYSVKGATAKIKKLIADAKLTGASSVEAQKEALENFDASAFRKEVVKAILGKDTDDMQATAVEMLQGAAKPTEITGFSVKKPTDMLTWLKDKRNQDDIIKNELLAIEKELNGLYGTATKMMKDAASMKKAGKVSEAATLTSYATKLASANQLALSILNILSQTKLKVVNQEMNEYIRALKLALKAAGKATGDEKLEESTSNDSIGEVDELEDYAGEDEEPLTESADDSDDSEDEDDDEEDEEDSEDDEDSKEEEEKTEE